MRYPDMAYTSTLNISAVTHADEVRREGRVRMAVKRALDMAFSFGALIALAPAMALIGLIIKLESPGPVVFRHIRIGENRRRTNGNTPVRNPERRARSGFGQEFSMYKFRTMRQDTPAYAVSPCSQGDSRITSIGRFLRKTSLDELPQLINVLKGDMSLVGPRPEMPFIVETYGPVHRARLAVKPGITGLWQLRGPRDRPIHEAIEWDLYYARNWSLQLDWEIMKDTAAFVLRARNH